MKCPTCGAENDGANRFCDQCGSRIEPSGGYPQAQVAMASQPTAAGPTCPSCGAAVLPGEAFCDECGASLSAAPAMAPIISNDAPTMFAPATPDANAAPAASATPATGQSVTCPACGQSNLSTDRFCDHCGASLAAPPVGTAAAPTVAPDQALLEALNSAPPGAGVASPDGAAAAVSSPDAETVLPEPGGQPPAAPADAVLAEAPTAEQPMVSSNTAGAQEAYEAERRRLEAEIARQQQVITQLETVQNALGAATPPAVAQSLEQARDAKAQAEAELAALQPPAPPVDPAEVARLEAEIARQQQVITQLETVQNALGAATPPAVAQSLEQARDAKAKAEADLAALTGGTATALAAKAPDATAAPAEPAAQAAAVEAALGELGTVPAPSAAVPVAPAATAISEPARAPAPQPEPSAPPAPAPTAAPAPRLVVDEGNDLPLPTDKREIIIGREDPISGIFPEIDLTPYGGETGGVSRQHARLTHSDGEWAVIDLNSTNYTRVDGAKIEPNVPVPIKDGTRLQFGRVAMTFRT